MKHPREKMPVASVLVWNRRKVAIGAGFGARNNRKDYGIKENLKRAQDRQNSYADQWREPMEFEEGDHVFLKVTPYTAVGRAMKTKMLQTRFIGPYQILRRIGPVPYQLALPPLFSNLHDVFHVSQLWKYIPDPSHVLEEDIIPLKSNTSYQIELVKILDRGEKTLRNKVILAVKVLWKNIDLLELT